MEKRTFLKTGLLAAAGAVLAPVLKACKPAQKSTLTTLPAPKNLRYGEFTLPKLSYDTAALEPHFDKMTMEIHHGKHHAAYVKNLNDALQNHPMANYHIEDILARLTPSDADKKIRNNGGGHWNHTFFWESLAPGGSAMDTKLAAAIASNFGSEDAFRQQFSDAAKSVFGSGWAWLCVGADKKMFITTTPNQDNPLMLNIVQKTGKPILGLDVWEHAYYLKYQNKRPDYITAFFNIINWQKVGERFNA